MRRLGEDELDYADLVKPTTYADEDQLHRLLTTMRREDPVALIETTNHAPFWAITKHADIIEISRADDQFLNAPRQVLGSREVEAGWRRSAEARQPVRTIVRPRKNARTFLATSWWSPICGSTAKSESVRGRSANNRSGNLDLCFLDEEFDFVTDVWCGIPLRVDHAYPWHPC